MAPEATGVDLPARPGAALAEREGELAAVSVVAEDGFTMISATHDLVDRAGIFDAELASYAARQNFAAAISTPKVLGVRN